MRAVIASEAGPWTQKKVCTSCGKPKQMPANWDMCPGCTFGEPVARKAYHLVALPRLAEARRRVGLSQRALAEVAGLSQMTISNAEWGGYVRPKTAAKISWALGRELEDLTG